MTDVDPTERLIEFCKADLKSADAETREQFFQHFGGEAEQFALYMGVAISKWTALHEAVPEGDNRKRAVVALLFTTLNFQSSSFKLFMSGHTAAAGSLYRQVLEAIAMTLLCSSRRLTLLDAFLIDRYSTSDAVHHLVRNAEAVNVRPEPVAVLENAYKFYHRYAHISKLTIATCAHFALGGLPQVGAFFDAEKLNEYQKEVSGRVSLAKVLPNIVDVVERNLAEW